MKFKSLYLHIIILLFILLLGGCSKNINESEISSVIKHDITTNIQKADSETNEKTYDIKSIETNEKSYDIKSIETEELTSAIYTGINNKDTSGLLVQNETDHFIFFSEDSDSIYIDKLIVALENNYDNITSKLEVTPADKTSIWIYPSLMTFHKAIGYPDAPNSIIAVGIQEGIYMVSPKFMTEAYITSPYQVIVHEFTHILQSYIEVPRPIWLNEGVASFFGKEIPNMKSDMKRIVASQQFPVSDEMANSYENLSGCVTYSMIEYMVNTYGYESLNKLLRKPEDYMNAFGISKEQFDSDFFAYINVQFGKATNIKDTSTSTT